MDIGRTRFRLVPLVALLALTSACGIRVDDPPPAPDTEDYVSVPLQVLEHQEQTLAFVPVTLAGEGPFLFALDTGASATVVAADVADQVGLPETGEQRQVAGIIGVDTVPVVSVEEWALGDVSLDPAEITVIDLPSPEEGEGLQGLLGSDVLSEFGRIVVDYDQQELQLPPS